jgi:hypothetical protein
MRSSGKTAWANSATIYRRMSSTNTGIKEPCGKAGKKIYRFQKKTLDNNQKNN